MTRHRTHTLLGTLIATAALVALVAPPASARIVERETFHDEFSGTNLDFCGTGMSVAFAGTVDGRYQVNSRGPGGFDYFVEKTTVVNVFTAPNGMTATDIQPNTINKDLSITANSDGTVTIIALLTGGNRTLGHDGHLIARNSGQVRFQIVYDPATDTEISNELIFGSTGTNDDFCAAVLADWGYNLT
jgi:hypothetical protein